VGGPRRGAVTAELAVMGTQVAYIIIQVVYCGEPTNKGDTPMALLTSESIIDTLNEINQRIQEIEVRL
jgi:hypothetical protein